MVCHYCKTFLYDREIQLKLSAGEIGRDEIHCLDDLPKSIVNCRSKCGTLYCSKKCEEESWLSHSFMCTGNISEVECGDHPLMNFKVHAIQSNEIFLLVAEWIIKVLVSRAIEILMYKNSQNHDKGRSLEDILEEFCDFTMVHWWDVVAYATDDNLNYNEVLVSDTDYGDDSSSEFIEEQDLTDTLKMLCEDSCSLFRDVIIRYFEDRAQDINQNDDIGALYEAYLECEASGIISADMFSKIIGSFEQNAIGMRGHHPLFEDTLFGDMDDAELDVHRSGKKFRTKYGNLVLKCMANAGLYDQESDDGEACSNSTDSLQNLQRGLEDLQIKSQEVFGHSDNESDNFNRMFTPFDGTGMFSTACKMNHSCLPNVLVRYRSGWMHPLILQCIALKNIVEGEELCISYIQSDDEFADRQKALKNYGFVCTCVKCQSEKEGKSTNLSSIDDDFEEGDVNDIFGSDSDDDSVEEDHPVVKKSLAVIVKERYDESSDLGSIPVHVLGTTLNFLIREGMLICKKIEICESEGSCDDELRKILGTMRRCVISLQIRHLRGYGAAANFGERLCYSILMKKKSWPSSTHTEAYGIFAVTACIAFANNAQFVLASEILDKAFILSPLMRRDISKLCHYISELAPQCIPKSKIFCQVQEFEYTLEDLEEKGLRTKLLYLPHEINYPDLTMDHFDGCLAKNKSMVIRSLAKNWKAVESWKTYTTFAEFGHRIVPIEVGSMSNGSMSERLMTLNNFFSEFILKSNQIGIWKFSEAIEKNHAIAYMAQYSLFEAMPKLLDDLQESLPFLGRAHPQINAWIGTGGTRTPLHYDGYDNILVQVIGYKYVRIYDSSEAPNLYVIGGNQLSNDSLCRQGNFSAVNCEMEDTSLHPLSSKAKFVEFILMPGDAVLIPAGSWHYIRSLTTSFSVSSYAHVYIIRCHLKVHKKAFLFLLYR